MSRSIRIHVDQPMRENSELALEGQAARHLVKVLRLKIGDAVILFGNDGYEFESRLVTARPPDHCVLAVGQSRLPQVESPLAITLIQAIGRGERMDYAIQKSVETGVAAIIPAFTERTEVRLTDARAAKRVAHWQGVATAACEQCGRTRVPPIHDPMHLSELDDRLLPGYFLDPAGHVTPDNMPVPDPLKLTLIVGPEGGLSASESRRLEQVGYLPLKLGPRVLRTETAGPVAIAVLQSRFGDWQ